MEGIMRFFNADGDGTCLWQCPITPTTPIPRHGDEVTCGSDIEYEGFVTNVALWYRKDGYAMADIAIKPILHDYEAGEAK
nr:MAG TPA: hypothetical protein [Caudoviricetes sp.]